MHSAPGGELPDSLAQHRRSVDVDLAHSPENGTVVRRAEGVKAELAHVQLPSDAFHGSSTNHGFRVAYLRFNSDEKAAPGQER